MGESVWTIRAKKELGDDEAAALAGTLLTDDAYHTLIDRDCDVTGPDGEFLLRFRKKVLRPDDCYTAWKNLRSAATQSENRGIAAGVFEESEIRPNIGKRSGVRYYQAKPDGTLSNTNRAKTVNSGIIGFFDRNPRIPYCRQTAFNIQKGDQFDKALPMIQAISSHFADLGGLKEAYDESGRELASSLAMVELWPGVCEYREKPDGRPDVKINWRAFEVR